MFEIFPQSNSFLNLLKNTELESATYLDDSEKPGTGFAFFHSMIHEHNCLFTFHAVPTASRAIFMEHYQQAPLRRTLSFLRVPRFDFSESPTTKEKQPRLPRPATPAQPIDTLTEALLDPFTTVGEAIVDSQMKSKQGVSLKSK